jgi:glutamate---cysteine ligase / carboxylate-amine ligase
MSPRKIGIEEELMLVDPETSALTAVSQKAVRAHEQGSMGSPADVSVGSGEPGVEQELFLQQIETDTAPRDCAEDLLEELRRGRRAVGEAARAAGAAAVAMPTPVLIDPEQNVTPKPRYQRIYEEFGELSRQSLVCAMHMHVDIADDDEGIAVIDRIRPWLPVLLAISANSPYWRGADTGYASWRSQIWSRWPSNGTAEPFGDADTYRTTAQRLVEWGAAFDPGMIYFDARLAERYPTVEIRVADVCTRIDEAVMLAGLSRALVRACHEKAESGEPYPKTRPEVLRSAHWVASRHGLDAKLVDVEAERAVPAREEIENLLAFTRPALEEHGDWEEVSALVYETLERGNGATRQREAYARGGRLEDVVDALVEETAQGSMPV